MDIINEIVYAEGKEYKKTIKKESFDERQSPAESTRNSDGQVSTYHVTESSFFNNDPLCRMYSLKTNKDGSRLIKYYHNTHFAYKEIFGEKLYKKIYRDKIMGIDVSDLDLCPDVPFYCGYAYYKDMSTKPYTLMEGTYELVFVVPTDEILKKASVYYNLPYPLPEGMSIESEEWDAKDWREVIRNVGLEGKRNKYNTGFKLASVRFENNKPSILKMYKHRLREGSLDLVPKVIEERELCQ